MLAHELGSVGGTLDDCVCDARMVLEAFCGLVRKVHRCLAALGQELQAKLADQGKGAILCNLCDEIMKLVIPVDTALSFLISLRMFSIDFRRRSAYSGVIFSLQGKRLRFQKFAYMDQLANQLFIL